MSEAKVGDRIERKALLKLATAIYPRDPDRVMSDLPVLVQTKTETKGGQWFCCTCGTFPTNNTEAQMHNEEKRAHKLAWLTADAEGNRRVEAP